jgi:cyanophycinase
MRSVKLVSVITCLILSCVSGSAQVIGLNSDTQGPENGYLLAIGGGQIPESIMDKFTELAGGLESPIVIIPTAAEDPDIVAIKKIWIDRGFKKITVLHTKNREVANSKKFTKPLREANAVWFGGGRQWRLVDSYKNTKTEKLLWKVLNRGGVIGGSSAGATIQGSFLARGDTKNNQIMMGDHQEGFAFIKNIAIDQHSLARNRHFDMFDILKRKPGLLGISIDEGSAILVNKNIIEVLGNSYVIVYDGSFWSREGSELKSLPGKEKLFYFLREGDKYDFSQRKIMEQ